MTETREGRVVTRYGAELVIEDEAGQLHRATGRKRIAHAVCGDRVRWQALNHGAAVTEILPRRNVLERTDSRGGKRALAANIDLVCLVFAPIPEPTPELIDRCLVVAHRLDADVLVVLNKCDLLASLRDSGNSQARRPEGHEYVAQATAELADGYRVLGYRVIATSTHSGEGMDELAAVLRGRTGILVGQSGVGKSSLVQALLPDHDIRIGAVSEATGSGRHTTTNAVLYHLPGGGEVIDSPGIRDFDPGEIEPDALSTGFVEFRPLLGQCRFQNCRHDAEPGCAVKAAVEDGRIASSRYAHYLALLRRV